MKPYLLSAAAGILVGLVYGLINVRSPAPPVIALVGLLGILLGEQVVPLVRNMSSGMAITVNEVRRKCGPHVFGTLPVGPDSRLACAAKEPDAVGRSTYHGGVE